MKSRISHRTSCCTRSLSAPTEGTASKTHRRGSSDKTRRRNQTPSAVGDQGLDSLLGESEERSQSHRRLDGSPSCDSRYQLWHASARRHRVGRTNVPDDLRGIPGFRQEIHRRLEASREGQIRGEHRRQAVPEANTEAASGPTEQRTLEGRRGRRLHGGLPEKGNGSSGRCRKQDAEAGLDRRLEITEGATEESKSEGP